MFKNKPTTPPGGDPDELKVLSKEDMEKIVRDLADHARNFNDQELSEDREEADEYYQGKTRLKVTKGRSQVIVSKVRDGIRSVLPSVARVFTSTDTIAEFTSDAEEDEKLCKDATVYCSSVFWKNGGYEAIVEGTTDALKARIGVVMVDVEEIEVPIHAQYALQNGATIDQAAALVPGDITESSDSEFVATSKSKRTKWTIEAIPPEEFLIDPNATSVEKSRFCAWSRNVKIYDIIERGFKYADIKMADAYEENDEKSSRQAFEEIKDLRTPQDPTSREVLFTQAFVRVDADGDGIAELRYVCSVGTKYNIIHDEPVNFRKFAVFKADIQPHVMHPISLAEDLMQDQDAQTALLRSIIDNAALVNSPRTEINENVVNIDDVKNGEIGAIIRVKQTGQINELATPFVAGQTLPVLQYLDTVSEQRSGITRISQGLDTDVLQSTSRVAAAAAVQGADSRLEMMIRNIGETGIKSIFMCILRCAIDHVKTVQTVPTMEGFQKVNPSWWHDQVSVRCNVGMGSGRIDEKKAALSAILPMQQQIIEKYGAANPICGWPNVRETLRTITRLSGIHNFQDYFPYVSPEALAKLDDQANQASQQKQQADQAMMQAQMDQMKAMSDMVKVEQQKSTLKFQTDMAAMQQKHDAQLQKLQAQLANMATKHQLDMTKIYLDDDRQRDKADMDFAVQSKEFLLSPQEVAVAEAKVDAPRPQDKIQ
jgi:hypothetical protein